MFKAVCGFFAALFVVGAAGAASAQVLNGGFEAGTTSWTTGSWGTAGPPSHTGAGSAVTGCVGPGCLDATTGATLSQTVAVTPGASYTLTFWYRTSGALDAPVELQALWSNGAPTNGGAGTCSGSCVYGTTTPTATFVQVSQTVVATGPNMTITFLGRNDPAGIYVDDVSLALLAPPATIPTLSEWAMILFGLMLAGFAALTVLRRRAVHV